MTSHLFNTYGRLPVTFTRGEGAWLWDTENRMYLDALTGVAVCSLGHCHPAVVKAISEQAGQLMHTSNWYGIAHQETLGTELCRLSGMDKAFFSNSGAEANEAAIKLARLYGHKKGILNPSIIVTEQSFHGRTMATLTATGNRKVQAGFEPLLQGFVRVPFADLDAIRQAGAHNNDVVVVMVEPVLGEGGVIIPPAGYLKQLRELCDEFGWLLILDEIQTGMGRTGRWFACQHENILPDVMTLAKALGNGMPIGACLARAEAADVMGPGNHGSTFGGNPLACRAALAVIQTMESENLVQKARALGENLLGMLRERFAGRPGVREVRGHGLMLGIQLEQPCAELMTAALAQGLLINVTGNNVVRLLPPMILSDEEAGQLLERLDKTLTPFLAAAA